MNKQSRNIVVAAVAIVFGSLALALGDASSKTVAVYRPSKYSGSAGNAYQVSMVARQAKWTPRYGMSAGNASQVSMSLSGYRPSKYSGSAGNAYQLSMSLLAIGKAAGEQ
jgi:hypothetical protein